MSASTVSLYAASEGQLVLLSFCFRRWRNVKVMILFAIVVAASVSLEKKLGVGMTAGKFVYKQTSTASGLACMHPFCSCAFVDLHNHGEMSVHELSTQYD